MSDHDSSVPGSVEAAVSEQLNNSETFDTLTPADIVGVRTHEYDIGSVVELPDSHHRDDAGQWVRFIDYTQPAEYGPSVWAYEYLDGTYGGLYVVPAAGGPKLRLATVSQ
jgi:hypothetical protein